MTLVLSKNHPKIFVDLIILKFRAFIILIYFRVIKDDHFAVFDVIRVIVSAYKSLFVGIMVNSVHIEQ
jgi:hypothetical protein